MRRAWGPGLLGFIVGALVAVPAIVLAGFDSSPVEFQLFRQTTTQVSTSNQSYRDIANLSNVIFCTTDAVVTGSVNLTMKGAPVEIRLRIDDNFNLAEPPAQFDPAGRNRSFSYEFVRDLAGTGVGHAFDVEWRSPTGGKVTLLRGDVIYRYTC
jgi:hypothetical protein